MVTCGCKCRVKLCHPTPTTVVTIRSESHIGLCLRQEHMSKIFMRRKTINTWMNCIPNFGLFVGYAPPLLTVSEQYPWGWFQVTSDIRRDVEAQNLILDDTVCRVCFATVGLHTSVIGGSLFVFWRSISPNITACWASFRHWVGQLKAMADSCTYCIRVSVVMDPEEIFWMVVGYRLVTASKVPHTSLCTITSVCNSSSFVNVAQFRVPLQMKPILLV